jgi:hypothetical protein
MPYKTTGKTVWVQRDGRWRVLKTHESAAKAKRHLTALRVNVEAKERR